VIKGILGKLKMLKNKKLTYITLFSSAGVGCYGFHIEDFQCVATNEIISKRMDIQKANYICPFNSGYITGDLNDSSVKERIYTEIQKWERKGNDKIDLIIATPPCQGISVINHKKNSQEIKRNSLAVDSVEVINKVKPRIFIFENVMAFEKTMCIAPNGEALPIGDYIRDVLGEDYVITGQVMNLMNHGSNSSRTRTLVVGVDKRYKDTFTPYDLFPDYQKEKTLRDIIYNFPKLNWGEVSNDDFYHGFRTYGPHMQEWIKDLKEGESAFDNTDPQKKPHRIIEGKLVENKKKNRDKYTRQKWDRFIQCVHTRNDQLAAQNTIHPEQDRVFSIRELMEMMTIPKEFKWIDKTLDELNLLSDKQKQQIHKNNELTIRACIGEAVPTEFFRRIAQNIKLNLHTKHIGPPAINKIIAEYGLSLRNNLNYFLNSNPLKLGISALMRIAELCNALREENAAFYTNKFIVNEIMGILPNFSKEEIRIIEPSVGVGNFIPFLIKKYENVNSVIIDVVDIDKHSLEMLGIILEKIKIPSNFTINIIHSDFLKMEMHHTYDLAIGNPPFSKIKSNAKLREFYLKNNINKSTNALSELFLEKCLRYSSCVSLVLNKTILSSPEFDVTRDILRGMKIASIIDFGRYGFTGVSIETICLTILPNKKPQDTFIFNLKYNKRYIQSQLYITDTKFPYFIIYRNSEFDHVAAKLEFNIFDVFRDRQITKSNTQKRPSSESLWVVKAKNLDDAGGTVSKIKDYDLYISEDKAQEFAAYQFVNRTDVYLTPNMTYNPRVTRNIPNTIADGSTAILIPKHPLELTSEQIDYFSTDQYRKFYKIARNLSTQSINVDQTSVFFYGALKNEPEFIS